MLNELITRWTAAPPPHITVDRFETRDAEPSAERTAQLAALCPALRAYYERFDGLLLRWHHEERLTKKKLRRLGAGHTTIAPLARLLDAQWSEPLRRRYDGASTRALLAPLFVLDECTDADLFIGVDTSVPGKHLVFRRGDDVLPMTIDAGAYLDLVGRFAGAQYWPLLFTETTVPSHINAFAFVREAAEALGGVDVGPWREFLHPRAPRLR